MNNEWWKKKKKKKEKEKKKKKEEEERERREGDGRQIKGVRKRGEASEETLRKKQRKKADA